MVPEHTWYLLVPRVLCMGCCMGCISSTFTSRLTLLPIRSRIFLALPPRQFISPNSFLVSLIFWKQILGFVNYCWKCYVVPTLLCAILFWSCFYLKLTTILPSLLFWHSIFPQLFDLVFVCLQFVWFLFCRTLAICSVHSMIQ